MELHRSSHCYVMFIVLSVLIINLGKFNLAQPPPRMMLRPLQPIWNRNNKGPPVLCTHDALLIYQDCRICACLRPNRLAKCFKKSCDLRTKDTGQCPQAILRVDDGKVCTLAQVAGCKIDADCPGPQLCCFDFCGSPRCMNPMPLDDTTGRPLHGGRGYQ